MKELSDTQLALLTITTTSGKAFTELVRRHRPALLAFLYRLAGDDMNVEDLVQIALLKAYQKIAQYRSDASFKTWLFRIGYTEFLQLNRRRKPRARMQASLSDNAFEREIFPVDTSLDLNKGLGRLSDEERAAILFCDAVGFSNREAALAMDVPLGSVKTYVKRARRKMHDYLEGESLNE